MAYKVVVSDADETYQLELDDKDAKIVNGLKIGDEFNGGVLGLKGYKLTITGSNKWCMEVNISMFLKISMNSHSSYTSYSKYCLK